MDDVRRQSDPREVDPTWYLEAFGADYLDVYRQRSNEQAEAEVRAVVDRWGLDEHAHVLDLCCGAGRHLEPLTRHCFAVGLDRSSALLERARQRVHENRRARVVQGDMRHLPFDREFHAVAMFFTSFGYFFEDEENQRVLREIARVLKPAGRVVLDLMDKQRVIENLVPESARDDGDRSIQERRWITGDGRRVEKEILVSSAGGPPQRFTESVRLYEPDEICSMLAREGFATELTGSLDGEPHRGGVGPRMIAWGQRSGVAR